MTKSAKLKYELLSAVEYAECKIPDADYGICNFDSLMIRLPHYKHDDVHRICKDCGMHAWYEGESFWNIRKLFGQAERNTLAQQYMRDYLSSVGYEVYVNYRMD